MDSYFEQLRRELEDATRGASARSLAQAPAGKWNAVQILEHLLLTYQTSNRGLARCLEQSAPVVKRATLKDRFATLLVVNIGYIPNGRRAPERVAPKGMQAGEVQAAIVPEIQKLAAVLDDCERKFGAKTKILDHLVLGPLTADEWRKFHWVHGRHHARQIRERTGKS